MPPKHPATSARQPISRLERVVSRALRLLEDIVKVPLFRCQHCGECLLSSTGFICCQNCPKRLRNGPCGGVAANGSCEVFPDRTCVWYRIYNRSQSLHRVGLLARVNGMHDWSLEGTSAWLNVFRKRAQGPVLWVRHDDPATKD